MAAILQGQGGSGDANNKPILSTSIDGGETWTDIKNYTHGQTMRVAIAGNNKQVLYLFGSEMEYSDNSGATISDKWGNIDALGGSGAFIGIAGGSAA